MLKLKPSFNTFAMKSPSTCLGFRLGFDVNVGSTEYAFVDKTFEKGKPSSSYRHVVNISFSTTNDNTLFDVNFRLGLLSENRKASRTGPSELKCQAVDYEASLARLRAQLACMTEERDILAHRLNLSADSSSAAQVDPTATEECQNLATSEYPLPNLATDSSSRKLSTGSGRPVMGLSRHLQTKQLQICDPIPFISDTASENTPGVDLRNADPRSHKLTLVAGGNLHQKYCWRGNLAENLTGHILDMDLLKKRTIEIQSGLLCTVSRKRYSAVSLITNSVEDKIAEFVCKSRFFKRADENIMSVEEKFIVRWGTKKRQYGIDPIADTNPSLMQPYVSGRNYYTLNRISFFQLNRIRTLKDLSVEAESGCFKEVAAVDNIYDLPEPEWVTQSLRLFGENSSGVTDVTGSKHSANSGFTPAATAAAEQSEMFDQLWLEAEDSVLRGPLSPRALLQFLSSLSKLAPYPRLADVANCAQLTWSRLLATLSCLQSDCLVLQTNLAEVKATADRIQCQMNQIDANWSAALRCASLADSCLEVADCLNQLYCTELAIVLYRQNRKMLISGRGCSTLSSSTSSSSFPGRHIKASGGSSNGISKSINQMPSTTAPSLSSTSPYHPYAVYAVPGSIGTESNDISSIGLSAVHLTLKNLKLYRHQAELVAHSLLDRYDLTDTNPERIYPITSSTNGGLPSLSRAFSRPPQAPLSPGIFSTINSPPCPNIPSTHSLTNTSLYANSWYVSLGRLGHSAALTTAAHCEQTSLGSCAGSGSLLSKPAGITLLPFSPARNSTKSSGHHSNAVPEMSGGWQTPDSGAGSSGTNEVLQQPTLLHHPFFPTFGCLAPGVCHTEPNPYSTLLDLLPPLWANPLHRNDEHLICVDTDSDSSDSSDAISTAATGSKIPEPVDASDPHALHLSTWTRAEERKLRGLLHYLMHSRRLVQSTMADMHMFATNSEEENESRRTCESVKSQEEFGRLLSWRLTTPPQVRGCRLSVYGLQSKSCRITRTPSSPNPSAERLHTRCTCAAKLVEPYNGEDTSVNHCSVVTWYANLLESSEFIALNDYEGACTFADTRHDDESSAISSLGKLSLNVLIENSVLLQELCHVKEERADLNARLYLLEKELHANRLALESHMAAEQALRAHLDVLVTEQNYRLQKTDGSAEVDKTVCLRTGQSETSLLRGQVK
ncbi:colorectal mutant cancer protein, partial [Clonorchis sinensis]